MKKITSTFVFTLIAAFLFAGTVEYTYNYSSPAVKDAGNFQTISFENTFLTGIAGEPVMPYQAVKLLLPPGEEAVSVDFAFEIENILDGSFSLVPRQPAQPYSIGGDGTFHQKMDIYQSENAYPSSPWGEYTTHFLNGYSYLLTSFTPAKYIPATGQISYYGKVTITVETRQTDRAMLALKNLSASSATAKLVNSFAQNPSLAASYSPASNREGEYQLLIITPQNFTLSFQQLADLYLVRGMKTEIVSVESISSGGTGMDLQEKIRNYIISEYQAHGIVHVLLGGDVEHIPARGFYCHVQSSSTYEDWNIPSDLYYSGLDGNWDTDGDGTWGEIGEDDLLPDVSVARFPVSNISQLQKLLHKTISYQDYPVTGEMRDILIAGEELWQNPLTYGEDYLELLIGYQDENGYVTDGMYDDMNFTKLYDSEAYWSGWDLVNSINEGKSFIHHSGHANQTYVMRLGIQDITNDNFSSANGIDHNYTLVYTHGCLCGAFDENDCIGEAMVLIDNFAVAGAFNSRYGWFNEGQTEGPSAHLHREFVDALYHDRESRIGSAHMISRIETSVWVNAPGQWEEGALRWCFYDCNIFGDPALGVWTDEPINIETTYPDEIHPGETSVPVSVASNGQPVEGLMCVIMADGEMSACCPTDESGNALINVPGGFADIEAAELVVSGYNCLPVSYPLNITVGLDENKNDVHNLSIHPNPFSDLTTLAFSLEKEEPVKISFYLLSGQLLEEVITTGKTGSNEIKINTVNWPEGIIQVRIIAGGEVLNSRIIHISE
jgi:hypothetical protein